MAVGFETRVRDAPPSARTTKTRAENDLGRAALDLRWFQIHLVGSCLDLEQTVVAPADAVYRERRPPDVPVTRSTCCGSSDERGWKRSERSARMNRSERRSGFWRRDEGIAKPMSETFGLVPKQARSEPK